MGCGSEDNSGGEETIYEDEGNLPFKIDRYLSVLLAGTITLAVGGIVVGVVISKKRDKTKKAFLVSQINKAYNSGEILDADYEELKKGLDPIQYKWLGKTFDYAVANKRRYNYLHSKYPKDIALDLFEQKHWTGMTTEQLVDSKGHPTRTDEEILKTKTIKVFIYETSNGQELFSFVGGVLEKYEHK